VLVRGEIVESGTHDELLARGAEYGKLYAMQFRDVETPEVPPEPPPAVLRPRQAVS
jgi:hypothetical protein